MLDLRAINAGTVRPVGMRTLYFRPLDFRADNFGFFNHRLFNLGALQLRFFKRRLFDLGPFELGFLRGGFVDLGA